MSRLNDDEARYYHVMRVAILAFIRGSAPIMAVEFARRAVPSSIRPTFQETEGSAAVPERPRLLPPDSCRGGRWSFVVRPPISHPLHPCEIPLVLADIDLFRKNMLAVDQWIGKIVRFYEMDRRRRPRLPADFHAVLTGSFGALNAVAVDASRGGAAGSRRKSPCQRAPAFLSRSPRCCWAASPMSATACLPRTATSWAWNSSSRWPITARNSPPPNFPPSTPRAAGDHSLTLVARIGAATVRERSENVQGSVKKSNSPRFSIVQVLENRKGQKWFLTVFHKPSRSRL